MSDTSNLAVIIPKAEHPAEQFKIEFVWNSYLVIVTRRAPQHYSMSIYEPNNDGSFHTEVKHVDETITNLMMLRNTLEGLFESKVI